MGITVYRATCDQFDDCYGEWKMSEDEAIASFWECNTFSDAERRRVVVYTQKSGESSAIVAHAKANWDNSNGNTIEQAVREWANCAEAEVSETGDVWIANPQSGHWIDDAAKDAFVSWLRTRKMI